MNQNSFFDSSGGAEGHSDWTWSANFELWRYVWGTGHSIQL